MSPSETQLDSLMPFQTFHADNLNLGNGICVIRAIGDGKYELLKLEGLSSVQMGSQEMGELIRSDEARLTMIRQLSEEDWRQAELKVTQAARSAGREIFRFDKMIYDIQKKVYDLVLHAPRCPDTKRTCAHRDTTFTPELLLVSRKIRDDGLRTFYLKNLFLFRDQNTLHSGSINWRLVQNVAFDWRGMAKDGKSLRCIAKLPSIKSLHLSITDGILNQFPNATSPEKLFRGNDDVRRFLNGRGFDALLKIRGLDKVIVNRDMVRSEPLRKEEFDSFQAFLTKHLTKARLEPKKKPAVTKKAKGPTAKKKSKKAAALAHEVRDLA